MEYPVALISGSGSSKQVSIFPEKIKSVVIYYYVYNNDVNWDYVTIAGKPVHNAASSSGFRISPYDL